MHSSIMCPLEFVLYVEINFVDLLNCVSYAY